MTPAGPGHGHGRMERAFSLSSPPSSGSAQRLSPLRFTLFPMVHMAEQQFHDEVAARARLCQLIVAEGFPSRFAPAQEWMAQQRWGHLVDQVAGLRLETLGVPVRWEAEPEDRPKSLREQLMSRVTDVAGAAAIGLTRKFTDPRTIPSVDQAEEYDQSAENLTGGWLDRLLEYNMRTVRDAGLVRVLGEIHHDRAEEPVNAGVVFGAGHMPAVAGYLCGQLGCIAASAEWLTVASARSLPTPLSASLLLFSSSPPLLLRFASLLRLSSPHAAEERLTATLPGEFLTATLPGEFRNLRHDGYDLVPVCRP